MILFETYWGHLVVDKYEVVAIADAGELGGQRCSTIYLRAGARLEVLGDLESVSRKLGLLLPRLNSNVSPA